MTSVDDRLKAAGITLPEAPAPVANYVPFLRTGNLVYVSGQLPLVNGQPAFTGKVGQEVTPEDAATAARYCAINLIAQAKAAVDGDLERVSRVVKLTVFIACANDFTNQPVVANGASDLMVEVFGDKGRHTRAAVGTNVLPRNTPVEIEAVFEVE